ARSRTSFGKFADLLIAPSSQEMESPGKPGRFTMHIEPRVAHTHAPFAEAIAVLSRDAAQLMGIARLIVK
ncbi:hypothetical protein, partial [Tahibacter aquaticus]|uniref:hypothetical protein n=1 Tax=Tahibacter aquaticus TaxID=520092 RepID=UPI001AACA9B2